MNALDFQTMVLDTIKLQGKILYSRKVFASEKELIKQVTKHEARYNKKARTVLDFKSPDQVVSEHFSNCNICFDN